MNETFKTELDAFARDVRAICKSQVACTDCPLSLGEPPSCVANYSNFNLDIAIAAVEAWRESRKPKPEVIDKALDIYTLEVQVERGKYVAQAWTPKEGAEYAAGCLKRAYQGNCTTVSILSAKRFVLESHKEE